MDAFVDEDIELVREAIRRLCKDFDDDYWAACDEEHRFPWDFYKAMAEGGWVGIAIPEQYGGSGLGLQAACAILEEVHRSGGNGGACHAQTSR